MEEQTIQVIIIIGSVFLIVLAAFYFFAYLPLKDVKLWNTKT